MPIETVLWSILGLTGGRLVRPAPPLWSIIRAPRNY